MGAPRSPPEGPPVLPPILEVEFRPEVSLPIEAVPQSLVPVPGLAHPKDEISPAPFKPPELLDRRHRLETRQRPADPIRIPVPPALHPEDHPDPADRILHPNPGA